MQQACQFLLYSWKGFLDTNEIIGIKKYEDTIAVAETYSSKRKSSFKF